MGRSSVVILWILHDGIAGFIARFVAKHFCPHAGDLARTEFPAVPNLNVIVVPGHARLDFVVDVRARGKLLCVLRIRAGLVGEVILGLTVRTHHRLCFHDLRHIFATSPFSAGVPLKIISETLGHSSLAITSSTYVAVIDESKLQKASIIEGYMGDVVRQGQKSGTTD
jgi:hypothetical protein